MKQEHTRDSALERDDDEQMEERGAAAAQHQEAPEDALAYTGKLSEARFDRTVRVDKRTTVEIEDESGKKQADMIRDAVKRAKELVVTALKALRAPKDTKHKKLIKKHFKSTKRDVIEEAIENYQAILSGLNGSVSIDVENQDKERRAYVKTLLGSAAFSDIYLCAPWFKQGADKRAGTIVHEMSHKEAGTDDNAYYKSNGRAYQALDAKDSVNNADSYQYFALNLVGYDD